ncbi:MAG TPA: cysteine--tRNA ligase [Candidatus Ozemobacteraceae bacterium]|nr:cysteine--tRNA ligase [Candidatus Ozemobacteraceae bacterium]
MTVSLYNSLTRTKEPFVPHEAGLVGMYVCGPTVYGPPHLGHAKSYLTFDVLVKHLRQRGLNVRYVQNITDVGHLTDNADAGEDKIERQARLDQVHPYEIVDKYMFQYFRDMEALGIGHPNFYSRATQHIPEMIEHVQKLVEKGHAYVVDGNVYFAVESFKHYGKLSGRVLEEQREGVRVESRSDKRSARDFALWKKAEPGHLMKWNSPWGVGYPGWHIECSVMAQKYLGDTVDIHGGGLENMFPHHECEIAQAEALTGKPFVRFWVHNNMVTVDGVKMGKSLGNFKTIQDLLKTHAPEALRVFLLSTHYRSPTNYTEEAIQAATTGLARLSQARAALQGAARGTGGKADFDTEVTRLCEEANRQIGDALDNDLDSPGAIAHLYNFVSELNRVMTRGTLTSKAAQDALTLLKKWGEDVLGIVKVSAGESKAADLTPIMDLLIEIRKELKAAKRFDLTDQIRDRLKAAGILIEDTREGARWRLA